MQIEEGFDVESNDSPTAVVDTSVFIRRSQRNPDEAKLARQDVQRLCEKIKSNHPDTVVFKMKDHMLADVTSAVFDEILKCFWVNDICEAMYIQNLSCVKDQQLKNLIDLLRVKKIWCLNVGEIYDVSNVGWVKFCDALPSTNITHLYVSEHIISLNLKNKMRDHIRANRKKHDLHSSTKNIRVIMRCTNMWWNPINAIKHQLQYQSSTKTARKKPRKSCSAEPRSVQVKPGPKPPVKSTKPRRTERVAIEKLAQNPNHPAYWAEGTNGEGAGERWQFNCLCKEVCSSYEDYRYHPTGHMYACTVCGVWSHTDCMMPGMSDEDIKELGEVFCKKHLSQKRRERLSEMREMDLVWKDGEITSSGEQSICTDEKDEVNLEEGVEGEEDGQCMRVVDSVVWVGDGDVSLCSVLVKRLAEEPDDDLVRELGETTDNKEEVKGEVTGGGPVAEVDGAERPDTPELARGEVSNDPNSSDSTYGFEMFDKPSSIEFSPQTTSLSSSSVLQPQLDELLLLPPSAENSDLLIHMGSREQGNSTASCPDNFSTTTEADTESASSDLSRDGRAYSMGDSASTMPLFARQKDGFIPPPFVSNDLLYLSSPNKQNLPTSATDCAVPTQQEFGNYPLLTSLLGGPTAGNPPSAATDVGRGFMAPGDMSYFPLRDLTRLTPTMTSLPSSLDTMVGDSVHRGLAAKAKMKPTAVSQQKTAGGMYRAPASSVNADKKRIASVIPSSASLESTAMAPSHIKRKDNSKPTVSPQSMTTSFVRQSGDKRSGEIHSTPDFASTTFADKCSNMQAAVKAQVEAKKNIAIANSLLSRPDVKLEEANRPVGDRVAPAVSAGAAPGTAAAVVPKAMLQIPSGADIARALAERKELQARKSAESGSDPNSKTGATATGLKGITGVSRGALGSSRPTLADIARFREVSKKDTKRVQKVTKDAAQQQALAVSMLAASSAHKQQRATSALAAGIKKELSVKSPKAISVGPGGVLQGPPKKKRTSKGAKFRMYTRVFVPAFKIEGSITEEKNGGWKYVQFDVGIPLPLPPSLAASVPQSPRMNKGTLDGKWCRACDMEEICSSNGSEGGCGLNSFGEQPYDNTEEDESGSYGSEDGSAKGGSEVGFRHDLPDGYDVRFDDDVAGDGDDMSESLAMRRKRDRADSMDASNNVFYSNSMSPSEREVVLALGMNTKLEDSMTGRGVSVAIGSAATMDDVDWHTIGLDDDTEDWNL